MRTSATPTSTLSPGPSLVTIRRVTSWLAPTGLGNLIELVVLAVEDGVLVIHAMTLRRSTQRELFGGERS